MNPSATVAPATGTSPATELRQLAHSLIERLDLDVANYPLRTAPSVRVTGDAPKDSDNLVLLKDRPNAKIIVKFAASARGNRIFFEEGIRGSITLDVRGKNCLIYLGKACALRTTRITVREANSEVFVGGGVSTTAHNTWLCPLHSGLKHGGIVIGDDCMFSSHVIVRTSDSHLMWNRQTGAQINAAAGPVIVEPHTWIGAHSKILKSVRVGACSVIAMGSVVTRSVPRYSVARGIPATFSTDPNLMWSRSGSALHKKQAEYYADRFPSEP